MDNAKLLIDNIPSLFMLTPPITVDNFPPHFDFHLLTKLPTLPGKQPLQTHPSLAEPYRPSNLTFRLGGNKAHNKSNRRLWQFPQEPSVSPHVPSQSALCRTAQRLRTTLTLPRYVLLSVQMSLSDEMR